MSSDEKVTNQKLIIVECECQLIKVKDKNTIDKTTKHGDIKQSVEKKKKKKLVYQVRLDLLIIKALVVGSVRAAITIWWDYLESIFTWEIYESFFSKISN